MKKCLTCTTEFPAAAAGRGRPVAYCSDSCRLQAGRVRKRGKKSAIDTRIEAVMQRIDELERRINRWKTTDRAQANGRTLLTGIMPSEMRR